MTVRFKFALLLVLITSQTAWSEPFDSCPSEAFLFQKNPVNIYGVDLLTGQTALLQNDAGIPGNINGVGFNFDDRYLYGFNTTRFSVVKIHRDFTAEELPVSGLPDSTTFYVGDVSESVYWVYRKGVGLYRIVLDPNAENYLNAQKVEGADVSLTLTDFAFHPTDGRLYAVDNRTGFVYRINHQTGQFEYLGASGETGTFGAAYFDVDGYFYLGRNNDGYLFRLDLRDPSSPNPTAQFFAQGPASSQNDGARCAFAPVVSSNVDWGDAPDSYGTSLEQNGPRHQLDSTLFLGGDSADGELAALVWPASDDEDLYDDEDGVSWSNVWVAGLHQTLNLEMNGEGYVSIWVDWNGDGDFNDAEEHAVKDRWLVSGTHSLPVLVPYNAVAGTSWMRVRLSRSLGLLPTGGASEGEVEDYPITIERAPLSRRFFPSASGWTTLVYEDRWPAEGDYDFNDVVLSYRLTETWQLDHILRIDIEIQIKALGADYHSGFAVQLPGFSRADILHESVFMSDDSGGHFSPSVVDPEYSLFTLADDLAAEVNAGCSFYRTVQSCMGNDHQTLRLSIPIEQNVLGSALPDFPYDPFVFGTSSIWRGQWLTGYEKNRIEIHLADVPGSAHVYSQVWQIADDDSFPEANRYYRTSKNLPWGLLLSESWRYPKEGVSLLEAYPQFQEWAESSGTEAQDWYLELNANTEFLY